MIGGGVVGRGEDGCGADVRFPAFPPSRRRAGDAAAAAAGLEVFELEAGGEALALAEWGGLAVGGEGGGGGGGGDFVGGDFGGEDAELGDDVAGGEVAEESLVGLGLVVGAFDEDAFEEAGGDFRGGVGPDLGGARGEGEGVRFDVAEDEDFVAGVVVAEEEGGAVDDAGAAGLGVLEAALGGADGDVLGGAPREGFGEGFLRVPASAAVAAVVVHAFAVADAPGFDGEAVADFDVASAFAFADG